MLRPRITIPLWAAVAIPAAAYASRALLRGTLRPDLPQDAIVFGVLAVVLVLYATMGSAAKGRRGEAYRELDHRDHDKRDPGQHNQV
ncbi:MAG: hypothetical protein ACYCXZ_03510 [Coriobacteriia bacterium]